MRRKPKSVRRWFAVALSLALTVVTAGSALAATELAIPRFVALRSDKVNVRAGPGPQYPIVWVFVRRGLPVEVTAEFDLWRKVRDRDGAEGWVHRNLLTGSRAVIVTGEPGALYKTADAGSEPVADIEPGVIAQILTCSVEWCRVKAGGVRGWIERSRVWGVYPTELTIK